MLYDYIIGRAKDGKRQALDPVQHGGAPRPLRQDVRQVLRDRRAIDATIRCITETFDWVVVATGHFSVPNVPYFPGIETFPGRVLHAHDFRSADEFKGKDVLIVGASYSAEDIGAAMPQIRREIRHHVLAHAADGLQMAGEHRRAAAAAPRSTARPFIFKDGSSKEFDAIILCTGYQHHFPFLDDELKLRTHNRMHPPHLYKGIFWIDNPKLIYLGMQDQFYTFSMFDAQAWYARDVILGRIKLPSKEEMAKDDAAVGQARGGAERRLREDRLPGRLCARAVRGDRLSEIRHRHDGR